MAAFRNDEYLWWQVAEYTYDTFDPRLATRVIGPKVEYAKAPKPDFGAFFVPGAVVRYNRTDRPPARRDCDDCPPRVADRRQHEGKRHEAS